MNFYYITGASSGIGKAIATALLEREDSCVVGISRTCSIVHANYSHVYVDLGIPSDVSKVTEYFKHAYSSNDTLCLINNAGVIDPIQYACEYQEFDIQKMLQVNLISSIQLISAFLKIPNDTFKSRVILSVSSGAATKVIDGWSLYGTAKAGIDHFSNHVAKELELSGDTKTRIFSIAPGVVDTPMQQKIRESVLESFSTRERFIELHHSSQLVAPKTIAEKYCLILDKPEDFSTTVFSLRDII